MRKILKKISAILIYCLLLETLAVTAFAQNQTVDNPGFDENLYYWDWKNATMERVTENSHSGEGCGKVKLLKAAGRVRYAYNFLPDVTYEISIWVRLESGSDTARIMLSQDELFGSKVNVTGSNVNVSTAWTKLTMNYTYQGDEDLGWNWVSVNWGSGKTTPVHYLDDLSITPLNAADDDTNEIDAKTGEIAKNCGIDKNTDGYNVKNAKLSIVTDNTYLKTLGSGKVSLTANGGYVGQEVNLKGGKSYLLSARVKTDGEILPFEFGIDFPNQKEIYPAVIHKTSANSVGKNWSEISAVFTLADIADELSANIYIAAGTGKKGITYYFDEFSVCESITENSDNQTQGAVPLDKSQTQYTIKIDSGEFIKGNERIRLSNPISVTANEPVANVQELAKILDIEISVNGAQVHAGEGINQIILKDKSRIYTKNNISYPMAVAAVNGKNAMEAPISVIAECAGFTTEYNMANNTVKLTK